LEAVEHELLAPNRRKPGRLARVMQRFRMYEARGGQPATMVIVHLIAIADGQIALVDELCSGLMPQRRLTLAFLAAQSRLHKTASDCVAGECDAVFQMQLVEDVCTVALDRVLADRENLPDLAARVPLGDQLHDLSLSRR
jgi:hypothetical protein